MSHATVRWLKDILHPRCSIWLVVYAFIIVIRNSRFHIMMIFQTEQCSKITFTKKHKMILLQRTALFCFTSTKNQCSPKKKEKFSTNVLPYIFFFPISMVNTSSTCQCTPSMKSKAEICHKSYLSAREIQIAVSTSARGALIVMLKP